MAHYNLEPSCALRAVYFRFALTCFDRMEEDLAGPRKYHTTHHDDAYVEPILIHLGQALRNDDPAVRHRAVIHYESRFGRLPASVCFS